MPPSCAVVLNQTAYGYYLLDNAETSCGEFACAMAN